MPLPDPRTRLAEVLARQMPSGLPETGRRRFLQQASGLLLAGCLGPGLLKAASMPPRAAFTSNPFTLGVASGYPRPDGMVLWTRLASEPMNNGGIEAERLPVDYEVATDANFREIVRKGSLITHSELGHSLHLELSGLEPDHEYFYRFHSGDASSIVGRTRTAPAANSAPRRLKLALASCQNFEQGYFSAYRHLLADQPDLVLFVGDYIYESSWGEGLVRKHRGGEARSLIDYRNRYGQYKLDADLQAAHAALPWACTWDDHEVDNDYAGDQSEQLDPQLLLRRAAAYQAYYEHQPLPRSMLPRGADMRIYTHLDFGDLVRIYLLDDRQYRSPQVCQPQNRGGSGSVTDCPEVRDRTRTLLGEAQQQWLEQAFASSKARWNVLGQQTLFANQRQSPDPPYEFWTDGWDGYPHAREQVLAAFERHQLSNPLILGGDVHAHYACDVRRDHDNPGSPIIASEICGTSLCSDGLPQELIARWHAFNEHIHVARADVRGYALIELERDQAQADLRMLDDVRKSETRISSLLKLRTENGHPGWRAHR